MVKRFLGWLRTLALGTDATKGRSRRLLIGAGLAMLSVGIALWIASLALGICSAGTTMARFLTGDHSETIISVWGKAGVLWVAWLHLIVDLAVFLPAYVVFNIALAFRIDAELSLGRYDIDRAAGDHKTTDWPFIDKSFALLKLACAIAVVLTLLLGLADMVENISGMVVLLGGHTVAPAMGFASCAKRGLSAVVIVLLLVLVAFWYFQHAWKKR